jgi:hypothetical protein
MLLFILVPEVSYLVGLTHINGHVAVFSSAFWRKMYYLIMTLRAVNY